MTKYWQKRPVFEAVQLKPKNVKKIKKLAGCTEVGFSDNCCFFTLYSRQVQTSQDSWIVLEPNFSIKIWNDREFKEVFEQAELKKD